LGRRPDDERATGVPRYYIPQAAVVRALTHDMTGPLAPAML